MHIETQERGGVGPGVRHRSGRTLARGVACALAAWLAAALCPPATGTEAQDAAADAAPLTLTETARLLAGVRPEGASAAVAKITQSAAWRQHSKAAREGDERLKRRLAHIDAWQAQHLAQANPGAPLLYPFSGPDFVNAYALFPDAPRYAFFSLESVGAVPRLAEMDEEQLAALFGDLRAALNDMVALNFFITPNMKENLQTQALQGTLPILLAMMGILDLHVESVDAYEPWPERARALAAGTGPKPALAASAMRVVFTNPRTARSQTLEYLSLDVSDHELRFYPEFLPWVRAVERPTVLLKSASYLLHGNHFRKLRRELLADAQAIVQDDTGMPYKTLLDAGFEVALFGQYEQPVDLFKERAQPELEEAFEKSGNAEPLPFPFGYNWRKEGRSGLILAQRAAAPAAVDHP